MKSAQLFYRSDRLTAILYFNDCVHIEVAYITYNERKKIRNVKVIMHFAEGGEC